MRHWEAEHFSLNLKTGELDRIISQVVFEGVNFQQAQLSLVKSKAPHLRLTGNWVQVSSNLSNNTPIVENETKKGGGKVFEGLTDPIDAATLFNIDDFLDWLEDLEEDKVREAIGVYRKEKMYKHLGLTIGHLKNRYGNKED